VVLPLPHPDILMRSDFLRCEAGEHAVESALADLYNMEHIHEALDELKALIIAAKEVHVCCAFGRIVSSRAHCLWKRGS